MSDTICIKEKQKEMLALFEGLEDELDRYSFLTALGGRLPDIPEELKNDEHLVKGCQSRVWLDAGTEKGTVYMRSYSDTLIVRGLLFILQNCIEGSAVEEFASCTWEIFDEAGLSELLTEDRQNGLKSIITELEKRIEEKANHF